MKSTYIYAIITMVINLKILFKNTTIYNEEIYNEFLVFHNKKYHLSYTFYTAFIIMLIIYCLAVQIIYHNYTLAIAFCCFFTIFFLWRFLHPYTIVKKELESEKIVKSKSFSFVFYNNKIKIRDRQNFTITYYFKLRKVFETEKFYYLYIDRTHAYVLDKNCFSIGNSSDFSSFIKKKCRFKYSNITN